MSQARQEQKARNVVVVRGGFVDGPGWEGVYNTSMENAMNAIGQGGELA